MKCLCASTLVCKRVRMRLWTSSISFNMSSVCVLCTLICKNIICLWVQRFMYVCMSMDLSVVVCAVLSIYLCVLILMSLQKLTVVTTFWSVCWSESNRKSSLKPQVQLFLLNSNEMYEDFSTSIKLYSFTWTHKRISVCHLEILNKFRAKMYSYH